METKALIETYRVLKPGPHSLGKLIEWKLDISSEPPSLMPEDESPLAGETN
jgi:hypothetical protein